jgi:biotin-(acetyl-CoA carboxylase) ligase
MDSEAPRARRLLDYLDDYQEHTANIAREVLNAELGKLHLQRAHNIKQEIKLIVEREAQRVRDPEPADEA